MDLRSERWEPPSFERVCEAAVYVRPGIKRRCELLSNRSIALRRSASAVPPTVKRFARDGKTGRGLNTARERIRQHMLRCLSRSIGAYRPPAARFNGMSDGIGAVQRAERQTEQSVEWLGND
jgi:hypothetical protein